MASALTWGATAEEAKMIGAFDPRSVDLATPRARSCPRSPARARGGSLMRVEESVGESRIRILSSPQDLTKHGSGPTIETGAATRNREYGNGPGPMPRDLRVRIGKAILVVAAADGELSDREMTWFLGQARSVGTPRRRPGGVREVRRRGPEDRDVRQRRR